MQQDWLKGSRQINSTITTATNTTTKNTQYVVKINSSKFKYEVLAYAELVYICL
jgi:hypothetical protein